MYRLPRSRMTISLSSPISAIILPGVLPPAPYCHEIATADNKGAIRKAYFLTVRYDETISLIIKWFHHYPPQLSFYQLLAVAYNLLGREDDKMEAVKVIKIDPEISVKLIKKTYSIAIRVKRSIYECIAKSRNAWIQIIVITIYR